MAHKHLSRAKRRRVQTRGSRLARAKDKKKDNKGQKEEEIDDEHRRAGRVRASDSCACDKDGHANACAESDCFCDLSRPISSPFSVSFSCPCIFVFPVFCFHGRPTPDPSALRLSCSPSVRACLPPSSFLPPSLSVSPSLTCQRVGSKHHGAFLVGTVPYVSQRSPPFHS